MTRGFLSSSSRVPITCVAVHRIARAGRHSSTRSAHTTPAITAIDPCGFTGTLAGISAFATNRRRGSRDSATTTTIPEHMFDRICGRLPLYDATAGLPPAPLTSGVARVLNSIPDNIPKPARQTERPIGGISDGPLTC
jgi:hypothetical protein